MEYYKINSEQMLLLSGHLDRFVRARAESFRRIRDLMEGLRHELEADPAEAICGILKEVCGKPPQGEEESRLQRRAASIPALCGAWESLRPKRLLVVYKHRQGLSAALTRATFWGSRTEITLLRRCGTGSCFEAAGDTDKGLRLEYDRGQDTLRLDGKIQFSRICDRPETDYKPKTGKRYERLPE